MAIFIPFNKNAKDPLKDKNDIRLTFFNATLPYINILATNSRRALHSTFYNTYLMDRNLQ
jgi:hypothetical protein